MRRYNKYDTYNLAEDSRMDTQRNDDRYLQNYSNRQGTKQNARQSTRQDVERDVGPEYEIIEQLGSDSKHSTTYLAREVESGEYVAIKIIPIIDSENIDEIPEYQYFEHLLKQRTESDIENIDRLTYPECHPNIVCYYNIFIKDGKMYIIMEYVRDGGNLFDWLKTLRADIKKPTVQNLISILEQSLLGLKFLHTHGIIHGNIKLKNILIDGEGTVKLSDFEFACFKDLPDSCRHKPTTNLYHSPEIIKELWDKRNDPPDTIQKYESDDVWALGVTMFVITNHHFPFDNEKIEHQKILMDAHDPESRYSPSKPLSQRLDRIIESMLEKDYEKRPTIDELLDAVSRL